MQKRKLLSEAFKDRQDLKKGSIAKLKNIIFEVDNVALQIITTFENCKFVFSENSHLRLNKCTFENCEIIGIDDYKNYLRRPNCGELILDGCIAKNLKLCKRTFRAYEK